MKTHQYGKIVLLVLLAVQISTAQKIFRVAQDGSAAYTKIQDAVDAAGPGDIVQIEDLATYKEQVTIDSTKSGLILKALNPTAAKKPTIVWQDQETVLPKTYNQSQHEDSINFDQNGALRVLHARNVIIEGIKVDGGGAWPFEWPGIWEQKYPLFHGNAAITLWIAGDVIIRNCDITNAYFGINVKDRNEGGIFGNANPADLDTWNIVPLAGFGRTGNHIIENNRIHDNSFGMFFESVWDQGSVIRYNLFYENHHTRTVATRVAGMDDGGNQPGGALFFKDHMLSPLAIYNNTFWHNRATFVNHWKAGGQHLIFNNIIAQPDSFANVHMDISRKLGTRMHHTVYAAQGQRPTTRSQNYSLGRQDPETNTYVQFDYPVRGVDQVRIMNGMDRVEVQGQRVTVTIDRLTTPVDTSFFVNWIVQPGARVLNFGNNTTVRWFETKFLSTDPTSPDFLVPDWDDPDVERLILDQGWPEAGILDADGSIADLGAIPKAGRPSTTVVVRAVSPVIINNGKATVNFDVLGIDKATLSDLKVSYIRWVRNVPYDADAFGPEFDSIPASAVTTVTVPNTPIKMGSNSLEISVSAPQHYGFFEMILQGVDSEGNKVATSVGFIPYRKVDYIFEVKVLDHATGKIELDSVKAGDLVKVSITPMKVGGGAFTNEVKPCTLTLGSGYVLYTGDGDTLLVPSVKGTLIKDGFFTKVPSNGYDRVQVNGAYGTQIFLGTSKSIKILPGPPDKVTFQDPPSQGRAIISGSYNGTIKAEDKWSNAVGSGEKIKVRSTSPQIGDLLKDDGSIAAGEDVTITTDATGIAHFEAVVTEGDITDTIPLVASLVIKPDATDNAALVVGKKKPRFFILYSDTSGKYEISVELRGCAGVKFPVTVIASFEGDEIINTATNAFDIDLPNGIAAYATEDPSDTVRISTSALENGKKKIWIKSTSGQHSNRKITITGKNDNTIVQGSRSGIYFDFCGPVIEKAAYFADNGDGQVDRLDIWYKEELRDFERPDSIQLYWPDELPSYLRVVKQSAITIDPNDARHLIVSIDKKFDPQITSTNKLRLGTSFWNDPNQPDAPTVKNTISIADSVGPVLTYAKVVEKLKSGNDTMFIRFSERVDAELVKGTTLYLVKKDGTRHELNVLESVQLSDTIRIVVEDLKENSPGYGDSLKIIPTGKITDMYTNHAHNDNRPVELQIKLIPANIVNAWYLDMDADGIVDRVDVKLDKHVDSEVIEVVCTWTDGNNGTGAIKGDAISYLTEDNTLLSVDVKGKFRVNDIKTSGAMMVSISYTNFEGQVPSKPAADKAAPVISSAEYHPGAYRDDGSFDPDTLKVTFSEETDYTFETPVTNPFRFYRGSKQYTVNLKPVPRPSGTSKWFEFELADGPNSIHGVEYTFPLNGDLINISTEQSAFLDPPTEQGGGNYQLNPENRKVELKVLPAATKVKVKVGPNPFNIATEQEVTFFISPQAKMVEGVKATASVAIYDNLGNFLFTVKDSTNNPATAREDKKIYLKWDGKNIKGRKVSQGSYLAIVKTVHGDINSPTEVTIDKFLVGVKNKP